MAEISNTTHRVCACDRCGVMSVQRAWSAKGEHTIDVDGEKLFSLQFEYDHAWPQLAISSADADMFRLGVRHKTYLLCGECAKEFKRVLILFLDGAKP